jgi:predicted acetyltransferase
MADLLVRRSDSADRVVLERFFYLFRHDMSELDGRLPNPDGSFRSEWVDSALTQENWAAYLALVEDHPVGFAFVRALDEPARVMNSFFIVRGARQGGYGMQFVKQVLASHPGPWEIPFQEQNKKGARFWRRVAKEVAGEAWHEEERPSPNAGAVPNVWLVIP